MKKAYPIMLLVLCSYSSIYAQVDLQRTHEIKDVHHNSSNTPSEFKSGVLNIIPNQSRDYIGIDLLQMDDAELTISTEKGERILRQKVAGGSIQYVMIDRLYPGLYTCTVIEKQAVWSAELVVE